MTRFLLVSSLLFVASLSPSAHGSVTHLEVAATGQIRVHNKTAWKVRIDGMSYRDASGRSRSLSSYWVMGPNEKSFLLSGKSRIRASSVALTLSSGGYANRWRWTCRGSNGILDVTIGYADLGPPSTWTSEAQPGRAVSYSFHSSKNDCTLVLRLENLSRKGDVDIAVFDEKNKRVASSRYSGTSDDRCMIQLTRRQSYRVEVRSHKSSAPVRFRVRAETVDYGDVMEKAVGDYLARALVEVVLLSLLADEKAMDRYVKNKLGGLAKDAFVFAALRELNKAQQTTPNLDPRGQVFRTTLRQVRRKLVSSGGLGESFFDKLQERIHGACH